MIQRIQSIFLLILGLCMVLSVFVKSWQEVKPDERVTLDAFSLEHVSKNTAVSTTPTFYIAILAIASALVAFYSISRFKNRLLQIKLGALNSLLMASVLLITGYFSREGDELIVGQKGDYGIGFFLPMAAMFCNLIANRFIRRDENLVRSADRMR